MKIGKNAPLYREPDGRLVFIDQSAAAKKVKHLPMEERIVLCNGQPMERSEVTEGLGRQVTKPGLYYVDGPEGEKKFRVSFCDATRIVVTNEGK